MGMSGMTCLPCGHPGEACCTGNLCLGSGCCVHELAKSTCIANGAACAPDQGSCSNGACQDGGCGLVGQPQCGTLRCTSPFTVGNAIGAPELCASCGGIGQKCCDAIDPFGGTCGLGATCTPVNLMPYSECAACGDHGQPCCAGRFCNDGSTCQLPPPPNPGTVCP